MNNQESSRDFPGEYRLDVEDFGPIAKASVDLRPLTVFIGPSNTGKSYLAILLYVLHQSFCERDIDIYGGFTTFPEGLIGSIEHPFLDPDDKGTSILLDELRKWALDNMNIGAHSIRDDRAGYHAIPPPNKAKTRSPQLLPKEVDDYIRSSLEKSQGLARRSDDEFRRCFSVDDMRLLVRKSSKVSDAKIELSIPRSSAPGMISGRFRLHEDYVEFSGEIGGDQSISNEIDNLFGATGRPQYFRRLLAARDFDHEDLHCLLVQMTEDVFRSLLSPLFSRAYYLPAGRTGLMESHQMIVSTLMRSATTSGFRPFPAFPVLSGLSGDFLDQLIGMNRIRRLGRSKAQRAGGGSGEQLAMRLEEDVLKGAVETRDMGNGYPSFDYRPDGWAEPLPLIRTSSMVSELAPVVLYVRHLVRPGDVLIIEEPESHLHPAMQVAFTRQLAALVRAGIRVVVTTHSEWLLQELSNLVRVSQLSEAERAGIAGGDVALDPSEVGAWLFRADPTEEGSRVTPVGLDESGLYPADFEDVAVAMHNEWAEISSRLGDDG